ncbi:DNA circularization protein [Shewanella sp. NIFS-20-20]|uniref:DNA circularization protein n=1 Tax=Shewanella sp. NIFS-20-20 TaxID=2853806 RepID=UPI001C4520E1|nr:DNA circularization N-terminal domain-containing protein [Shewanella sp. NIFS-20-20]MBV7315444.1 DNA circularization N-terminal domain-containing protein [Shewanella sp. NIFS-20-20]
MAFEDRLTASFRGVEFLLEEADGESGRRAIPHAYPKKEIGYTEDNGKVLTQERISGRVVGADYFEQLQAILEALNKPGAGELVHPWFGIRKVQVGKVSHKLVNRIDGTATINFEVFEVGENLFPNAKSDTAKQINADADNTKDAVDKAFEDEFDTDTLEGAGDMVDLFLDDLDELTRNLPSLPDDLREWTDRLMRAKDSIGELLAYPGELAREAMGLMEDIKGVVKDPIRALGVYQNVQNRWQGTRAELAITGGLARDISSEGGKAGSVPKLANPSKQAAVIANAAAFKNLTLNRAVLSECLALGDADIVQKLDDEATVLQSLSGAERNAILTGQQLKNIGYGIADRLAVYAAAAVESSRSSVWRNMRVLRQSVLADTRARAELLPQVSIYKPIESVPVALVAWQETANTERRDSIVQRNGFANPAFILPTDKVEVIN